MKLGYFRALLAFLYCVSAFAEAPVIDESENFALFEKQAARENPSYQERAYTQSSGDENTPLAHEDTTNTNTVQNNVDLVNKIQGLQQDIQELRGQLEVQMHDLKALQQQQIEFYKDLDARLRHEPVAQHQPTTGPYNLDNPTQNTPSDTQKLVPQEAIKFSPSNASKNNNTASRHTNPAEEQISYLAAYELINNKQYDEALSAMQGFVSKYPQGGYTANAEYWIGELYMVKKEYPKAIEHFELVLSQFPSSSKSSASMLKIGYALAAAGQLSEAKQRLKTVIQQYPDTHAAQLAMAKLESIGNR